MSILEANGVPNDRLESEGVQVVGGKVISLQITRLSTAGGMVFLEEFSDEPTAIDFTPAAHAWTVPDIKALQSGMQPRVSFRLYNHVTATPMASMVEIMDYMKASGQTVLRLYTSNQDIKDVDGASLPAGCLVELVNCNNSTFRVTVTGEAAQSGTWNYYSTSGTKTRLGEQLAVKSPNGTRWLFTVSDTGAISTSRA